MESASGRGPVRHADGRFGPGNPGRPRGARGRMTQRVALSLLRHFEENEAQILRALTSYDNIHIYMRLIDRMLARAPSEDAPELEALPAEEAANVAVSVRAALERVEAGEGSLTEIETALHGLAPSEDAAA